MKKMDVYFHGALDGTGWRGQVIGSDGSLKARTGNLFPSQERAAQAARDLWDSLQKQLREVAA